MTKVSTEVPQLTWGGQAGRRTLGSILPRYCAFRRCGCGAPVLARFVAPGGRRAPGTSADGAGIERLYDNQMAMVRLEARLGLIIARLYDGAAVFHPRCFHDRHAVTTATTYTHVFGLV
ncbi:hypothetical protein VUR80DRAFT_149 [Thermomyces stellatus]